MSSRAHSADRDPAEPEALDERAPSAAVSGVSSVDEAVSSDGGVPRQSREMPAAVVLDAGATASGPALVAADDDDDDDAEEVVPEPDSEPAAVAVRGDVMADDEASATSATSGSEAASSEAEVNKFVSDLGERTDIVEVVRSGALAVGRNARALHVVR